MEGCPRRGMGRSVGFLLMGGYIAGVMILKVPTRLARSKGRR